MDEPMVPPDHLAPPIPRRLWLAALCPAVLAGLCYVVARHVHKPIATDYLLLQDRWLLPVQLALVALTLLPLLTGWRRERAFDLNGRGMAVLVLALVALAYAGHRWLLLGYDLSRDEQMASFDTWIYAHGRLAWPLPAAWQGDAAALNLLFMLPVAKPIAWVSAYLPGNAALRAAVGLVGDPALTGPLLTGLSVALTWGCSRRLWPQDRPENREAGLVAVALLALSGQVVMAGMTSFAMPTHLAANLLWLWLFLADRRRSDLAALAVGFFATGIHQPLFHPLFVAPWLALLLVEKRWGRLALFTLGYAAIGLFWLAWPRLTLGLVVGPHSLTATGADYLSRLTDTLALADQRWPIMAANLLRGLCWQPLALLALPLLGAMLARREARAAALLAGVLLPLAVMTLILPYQGHGFGYRYLHGVLGNVALLGGYGWRRLAPWHPRLRPALLVGAGLSALVALPLQAALTHQLYAPFARASAAIDASGADYAIIGAADAPLVLDLVRNRPDLGNRPIRLSAGDIDDSDALAQRICHKGVRVALPAESFFGPINGEFHAAPAGRASARLATQGSVYADAGCAITVLR
jgi:hypothetical protein